VIRKDNPENLVTLFVAVWTPVWEERRRAICELLHVDEFKISLEMCSYVQRMYLLAFGDEKATCTRLMELFFTKSRLSPHNVILYHITWESILANMVNMSSVFWEVYLDCLATGFPNLLPLPFERKKWLFENYDKVKARKPVPFEVTYDLNKMETDNEPVVVRTRSEDLYWRATDDPVSTMSGVLTVFFQYPCPSTTDRLYEDLIRAGVDDRLADKGLFLSPKFAEQDSILLWKRFQGFDILLAIEEGLKLVQSFVVPLEEGLEYYKRGYLDISAGNDVALQELSLCLYAEGIGEDASAELIRHVYRMRYALRWNTVPYRMTSPVFTNGASCPSVMMQGIGKFKRLVPFQPYIASYDGEEYMVVIPNVMMKSIYMGSSPNLPLRGYNPVLYHPTIITMSRTESLVRIRPPTTAPFALIFTTQDLRILNVLYLMRKTHAMHRISVVLPELNNFPRRVLWSSFIEEPWWSSVKEDVTEEGKCTFTIKKRDVQRGDLRPADQIPEEEWFQGLKNPEHVLWNNAICIPTTVVDLYERNLTARAEVVFYKRMVGEVGTQRGNAGRWDVRPIPPGLLKGGLLYVLGMWFSYSHFVRTCLLCLIE